MKKYGKILTIGLSCALAFSLAACGDDDKPKSTTPGPDPDSIKTEQVTAEQWATAFAAIDSANVTCKLTERYSSRGMSSETYELIKRDGNKIYWEGEYYDRDSSSSMTAPKKVLEKEYCLINGGVDEDMTIGFVYDDENKMWNPGVVSVPSGNSYLGKFKGWSSLYSSFEYSENANAYVATDPEFEYGEYYDAVSVKIVDGKLSVVELTDIETHDGIDLVSRYIYQLYDYGTTSVTLPKLPDGHDGE